MLKKVVLLLFIGLVSIGLASSDYDRDITVKDQSRNDKVKTVFREMMDRYEEKDLDGFFSYVSEDRFLQDYMLFYEAIEKDMREYDTLSIDTWVDKITEDGVKRFLYVKWQKRYDKVDSDTQIQKLGYSRFLFDEINGKYKLIELAGNNFWGESLPEWREEVPQIAGQEPEQASTDLPDLVVVNVSCSAPSGYAEVVFSLKNIGQGATQSGSIEWSAIHAGNNGSGTYTSDLQAGETSSQITWTDFSSASCTTGSVTVDPNDLIQESDESNNQTNF